jgi:hypothetical protein
MNNITAFERREYKVSNCVDTSLFLEKGTRWNLGAKIHVIVASS